MAEGRSKADWSHTSHLLALLANLHRDPKKTPRPYKAADFDPHRGRSSPPVAGTIRIKDARELLLGLRPAKQKR